MSVHFRPVARQLHYSSGANHLTNHPINPLLVPDHSESSHVLRDSEFQGSSQDRLQFDSLLYSRAFTVTVHNMTGEILNPLK